jgi:catecholate siderophore receptor
MADKRKKKNIRKKTVCAGWPVAYRWLAVGTLVMYTAVGSKTIVLSAQEAGGAVSASAEIGNLPARRYNIAPGPLDTVISAFQTATGLRVEVQREEVRSIASPGVTGLLTAEEALERLLTDTGVSYRFTSAQTVSLEIAGPSQSIEVIGRIAPAMPKYTAPLRDIPQTITIIPKNVIEEQGATSLRDVLANVPGLTITAGEGGAPAGDNLTLRGFSARNDVFVDGVRDLGPQSRDPFNLEQVEVIKGPTSAYTGRGSTGGVINLVSKTPGLTPVFGFGLNFGTDRTKRFTGDVNTPVPFLGERTAFRMNAVVHESGVAGRDVVESDRWGVAPSLSLGLGTPTRLTLGYFKLKQDNMPDYGIPWVPANNNALAEFRDRPAPVPRESFYGLKSRDKEEVGSDLATIRFEHDFSDTAGIRNQLRFGRSTRDSITTAPRFASPDSLVINRNGPSWLTEDTIWDNQTDARVSFSTGAIKHSVVTGLALTKEHNERRTRTVTGTPTTTLFNPDPNQPFTGAVTLNPIVGDLSANSQSLYAFDTIALHPKFELNGGLRFDRFDVDGVNTTGAPLTRVDRMLNVRAGAVYKPLSISSLYFSYGTSMNPSLEGLSYQPADATLEPEKTYTYEAGTKWDLFSERLLLTAAVFRIEKTNARTPGVLPDDPPQVLEGKQRVNGIEFGVAGSMTRNWRMFAGYTLLDSKIIDSNNPVELDKKLINTPENSLNLWTSYSLRRFDFGGGIRFVDDRYGNTTNTREVGSYWTVDGMVSYSVNRHLDLKLNLYNLNDAYYFDRLGGGHLIPGAARSVMLSTNFRF